MSDSHKEIRRLSAEQVGCFLFEAARYWIGGIYGAPRRGAVPVITRLSSNLLPIIVSLCCKDVQCAAQSTDFARQYSLQED